MKHKYRPSSNVFFSVMAFLLLPILVMSQNRTGGIAKLKILIPIRNFSGFVTVKTDPTTGEQSFSGFAIQVFQAVMNTALATPIPFEFIPFAKPDGTMDGSFDDMLKNVSSKKYDGAAGEISILYSRTQWVDFTMPYLDTSISMLVCLRQEPTKSRMIPLATLTKYVVASSLAFSFVVALLFWFLEYRNDRHASVHKSANSSLGQSSRNHDDNWRSEMLGSMIQTRLVMILFFMVLLVLIACYTASQTSSLASQRPSGSFKNINQLIRKESNVGYREGSFIRNLLIQKGIDGSKLISLRSEDEMVSMLSKGTAQSGVDAIFADTPNLKILVAKHCNVFTIVPTYNLHAAGFGFAFYKGFEQLSDVSKGILRIIENGQLAKIQETTIGSLESCQDDPNAAPGLAFLDSDTLWILIAGAIAVFLLISIVLLLYCGIRYNTGTKKVVAYPCYLSPCC
ncbi:hypothetical protein vseg_020128 [Gypsophila vaccaria]